MKLELAKAIVAVADDAGREVTLQEDYSGRGMYGATCAAVVGAQSDIIKCLIEVAYTVGRRASDIDNTPASEREEPTEPEISLHTLTRKLQWDSMGRSDSIAY